MGGVADGTAEVLVDDQETVCRLGFTAEHPVSRDGHYKEMHDPETRFIRLEEISLTDLNELGFSLQRSMLYSQSAARAEAERRNANRTEKLGRNVNYRVAGMHSFLAGEVHRIVDVEGKPVFKVLQTPQADEPAHAEIRGREKITNSQKIKYRKALRDVLGPLVELDSLPE